MICDPKESFFICVIRSLFYWYLLSDQIKMNLGTFYIFCFRPSPPNFVRFGAPISTFWGSTYTPEIQDRYQELPCLKGVTFSKAHHFGALHSLVFGLYVSLKMPLRRFMSSNTEAPWRVLTARHRHVDPPGELSGNFP